MDIPLLRDTVVIFGLSVLVIFLFHRLRAPTILGFLLTGVLAGPDGLGLIQATEQVMMMAEIGVILLLFTVGIEVSLKDLIQLKKYVLVGGSLQVLLTILAVYALASSWGLSMGPAIFMGFLISLSSTAIVLRIIQKKSQFDSFYGRTTLGVLIFQDVIIVPMMLIAPLLPGSTGTLQESPMLVAAKAATIVILVLLGAKYVVPRFLYQVAKTRDRETFLLSVITICFAVAYLTSYAGLSLGLGAFLAGLIISESEYNHQAFGNVLPLRDAFTSFFFVSVGMLVDLNFLLDRPGYILIMAAAVMVLKSLVAEAAITMLGLPLRISILVGLALSQIGEFSFVLSRVGMDNGLISAENYQLFLDVAVITMAATSVVMSAAPGFAERITRLPLPGRLQGDGRAAILPVREKTWADHLLIVGYGINGQNLARASRASGIEYLILDSDPDIVISNRAKGEPIRYGDATQEVILLRANVKEARVLVIAISDPSATRRITTLARSLAPDLYIIARTRYLKEVGLLQDMGADLVIPEEFETSLQIFARVLERFLVSPEEIEEQVSQIRADSYHLLRSGSFKPACTADLSAERGLVRSFSIDQGSPLSGLVSSALPLPQGVMLLAVQREKQTFAALDEQIISPGDILILEFSTSSEAMLQKLFPFASS